MLVLEYTYNKRDLPIMVTESGLSIGSTTTTYDYDNRGRLVSEVRIKAGVPAQVVYDLRYEYDPGGNRTRKIDLENNRETVYHYDVNFDPAAGPNPYGSENNRLMFHETKQLTDQTLQSTTYYYYNDCANVTRVVTNDVGSDIYNSTRLIYASNGDAVSYVTGETWQWDGLGDPTNYAITYAREFRYK